MFRTEAPEGLQCSELKKLPPIYAIAP